MSSRRGVLSLAGFAFAGSVAGCQDASWRASSGTTTGGDAAGNAAPWAREDSVVDVVVSVERGGVTEGGTVTGVVRVGDATRRVDVGQMENWTWGDVIDEGETPTVTLDLDSGRERSTAWTGSMGTEGFVRFVVGAERIRVGRDGVDAGETRTPET